jgi:hypothetical protein
MEVRCLFSLTVSIVADVQFSWAVVGSLTFLAALVVFPSWILSRLLWPFSSQLNVVYYLGWPWGSNCSDYKVFLQQKTWWNQGRCKEQVIMQEIYLIGFICSL